MWGRSWGLRSAILVERQSDGRAVRFIIRHIYNRYRQVYRAGSIGAVRSRSRISHGIPMNIEMIPLIHHIFLLVIIVRFGRGVGIHPFRQCSRVGRPAWTTTPFRAPGAARFSSTFPCVLRQARPMAISQADFAQTVYSGRAATYDRTWHVQHALDFVKWGSMSPGQHVLDLATGTGLVALPAKRAVGPTGTVTGVDITDAMLEVARKKARRENLDVSFIRGDVMDLGALGLEEESYDVITSASCLPLLYDPGGAIKHWAGYLKVGGRLIVDVPTERSQLPSLIFEEVMADIGLGTPYGRRWVKGPESLEKLFIDTGLAIEQSLVADEYGSAIVFEAEQAGGIFDKLAASAFGKALGVGEEREKAKKLFVDRLGQKAGWDGMVREEGGFYVVVGKRKYIEGARRFQDMS